MLQQPQVFNLADLNGDDIQAIMNGLNELPAKASRVTMNKVEQQIITQVRQQQGAQLNAASRQLSESNDKAGLTD